jgi:hypothetical protein
MGTYVFPKHIFLDRLDFGLGVATVSFLAAGGTSLADFALTAIGNAFC